MKRKAIKKLFITAMLLVILLFSSTFNQEVYGFTYSNELISLEIPNKYEKTYEYIGESMQNAIFETPNTMIMHDVIVNGEENKTSYTQDDLDDLAYFVEYYANQSNYEVTFYYKVLLTVNGYRGMRLTYQYHDPSKNVNWYCDEYYFLTDNYEITLFFQPDTLDFIDSMEEIIIVHSIKINDTNYNAREIPFHDVADNAWYYGAVEYCYKNNIIKGTTATTFKPSTNLTRGMLVTILHRMEGSPAINGTSKFKDVQNSKEYYYTAVKWATQNNIISGYNSGNFGPNDPITREQLAVILSKYCKYKGKYKSVSADLSSYKDANKISNFAKEGMNWAVASGVITGNASSKTLNPQGTTTRAEAASMLYKYCTKIK